MKRTIAALAIALLPAGAVADMIFEHGGHTYKLVTKPTTWFEASAAAEAMVLAGQKGYLARIDSEAENAAVLSAVSKHLSEEQVAQTFAEDGSDAPFIWLGGTDNDHDGHWIWTNNGDQFWQGDFNGKSVGGRYTNWGIQPDNARGGENSLAMGLGDWPKPFFDMGSAGQWNDLSDSATLFYLVEFDGKSDLQLAIEEPVKGSVYSGIGMVRGWAVSSSGVSRIEVFIDGEYAFDLPHGGPHANAGKRFPEIEGAERSGYSTPLNYSALSSGAHRLAVKVRDAFGSTVERETTFEITKFHRAFIPSSVPLNLGWARVSGLLGNEIELQDVIVDGRSFDIRLKWNSVTQGFEITEIDQH